MTPHFRNRLLALDESLVRRARLEVLQVNLGNLCNQRCAHCHIDASPGGVKMMTRPVIDAVLGLLGRYPKTFVLDVTGGCPELNPHFGYLIGKASARATEVLVRNNLTVFFEPGMRGLPGFYRGHGTHLICSLPCYTRENVDAQRGEGVFDKSIRALRLLNEQGFGREPRLQLDLAHNPGGAMLPADQRALEKDYKRVLFERHGVVFNRLITITNAPINRFKACLQENGELERYIGLLEGNFNAAAAPRVMCRNLLSVGCDGKLYDCDFNQALGLDLKDRFGSPAQIAALDPRDLEGGEITFGSHCYCCTAGAGSSCRGALAGTERA